MASRSLADLHPRVRQKAMAARNAWRDAGLDVLITCTFRSRDEQAELYARGRTKPGRIVTNARPGESKHNHTEGGLPASLAFDVVPLRDGKPVWGTAGDGLDDDPTDDLTDDLELWQRVGEIGESAGLKWAGRWRRFREFPHFEG